MVTSQKVRVTHQWAASRQGKSFFRSGQIGSCPLSFLRRPIFSLKWPAHLVKGVPQSPQLNDGRLACLWLAIKDGFASQASTSKKPLERPDQCRAGAWWQALAHGMGSAHDLLACQLLQQARNRYGRLVARKHWCLNMSGGHGRSQGASCMEKWFESSRYGSRNMSQSQCRLVRARL